MEGYITVAEYAELHGLTRIAVKKRCERGRIPGAVRVGTYPHQLWLIPADHIFEDQRIKSGNYIGAKRARKKEPQETDE